MAGDVGVVTYMLSRRVHPRRQCGVGGNEWYFSRWINETLVRKGAAPVSCVVCRNTALHHSKGTRGALEVRFMCRRVDDPTIQQFGDGV